VFYFSECPKPPSFRASLRVEERTTSPGCNGPGGEVPRLRRIPALWAPTMQGGLSLGMTKPFVDPLYNPPNGATRQSKVDHCQPRAGQSLGAHGIRQWSVYPLSVLFCRLPFVVYRNGSPCFCSLDCCRSLGMLQHVERQSKCPTAPKPPLTVIPSEPASRGI
jgi:hypothetical protein